MCRSGKDILSFGKKTDILFKILLMVLLFGALGVFIVLQP